jgi:hypothetical protein
MIWGMSLRPYVGPILPLMRGLTMFLSAFSVSDELLGGVSTDMTGLFITGVEYPLTDDAVLGDE